MNSNKSIFPRTFQQHKFFVVLSVIFLTSFGCLGTAPQTGVPIQPTAVPPTQSVFTSTPQVIFPTVDPRPDLDGLPVRKPILYEIRNDSIPDVWEANSLQIQDMPSPDVQVHTGGVQRGKEYLFPIYWCARSIKLLGENLQSLAVHFAVNDKPIPGKYIFNYLENSNSDWKCQYFSVALSGWQPGAQYTLLINRIVTQIIYDGDRHYSEGTYTRKIVLDVY
jgi:hypothetical protein